MFNLQGQPHNYSILIFNLSHYDRKVGQLYWAAKRMAFHLIFIILISRYNNDGRF